ncbi:MAG TPA: HEAT repeat domain-containing protein [Prolixibacteraceae bacterium]|nr:HEAT repeat domain-containing protein [Prolixibacteraceae bacterium]
MKRTFIIIGSVLLFLFILVGPGVYVWGDFAIRKNINMAKSQYPGKAEDALIAYLLDSTNSPHDRSHRAINTLGQIESQKARPVLLKLYKNDPEGKTCYGKHDDVLCQYEIYKALNARQVNWWPLHRHLNK